ncbi:nucleotidyltransferase family protein [Achromobacter sp.]|uniref:nucleotidyltransferase family protein n=1 Tax=Achromobacter TaxID=222 RepID=UPI00257A7407|nr:nucleotidyltransferase family protein [Achromobacter sp.]
MPDVQVRYEQQLCALVADSAPLMVALTAVRTLGLSSWCIGAGVIRSLVWDALHGFEKPSPVDDVDVAYFDADAAPNQDDELQKTLSGLVPHLTWDVTNQARVHEWLVDAGGRAVAPLASLHDGLATWPEFATCVGVHLEADGALRVIAPHGLTDLFELRVRHNPRRAGAAIFAERVHSKQFGLRWPRLSICVP